MTREVMVWPRDSTFENFDWRVSIAEVREAGPFSIFENIDRFLSILKGSIELDFGDRKVSLGVASGPFAFPGDIACSGRPLAGEVTDLNIMTRRGRGMAHVLRTSGAALNFSSDSALVLATVQCSVGVGSENFELGPLDALFVENRAGVPMTAEAACFLIAFS